MEPEEAWYFFVRSAYRALLAANSTVNQTMGSRGAEQSFWKKLWRMNVLPKVHNFWWRVIKRFIPCRARLKERHLERIMFCQSCGRDETIMHALFECTWTHLFWKELKAATSVKILELHPNSWAIDIIDSDKVSSKDATIILCCAWVV